MKSCDIGLKEFSSTRIVKGGAVHSVRYSNPGALVCKYDPGDFYGYNDFDDDNDDDDDDDDDDDTVGAGPLAAAP